MRTHGKSSTTHVNTNEDAKRAIRITATGPWEENLGPALGRALAEQLGLLDCSIA
jgi:hypothetical protein